MRNDFKNLSLILLIYLVFFGEFIYAASRPNYERIVSLAPSITETIYALGADEKIVGVTKFCDFPPEAKQKPQVGGLFDVNYELVYSLNPDLVLIQINYGEQKTTLEKMGIKVVEVETRSVQGILESIRLLGELLERQEKAQRIIDEIESKIRTIKEKMRDPKKPRVLITFLRPVGEGHINEVYIAGNHTFYDDLLRIIGAENAYHGSELITSPIISTEGILNLDPDVIIEVMAELQGMDDKIKQAQKDWDSLPQLKAYQTQRIHVLNQSYIGIPGPRLTQTLDTLARLIHPEVKWDK